MFQTHPWIWGWFLCFLVFPKVFSKPKNPSRKPTIQKKTKENQRKPKNIRKNRKNKVFNGFRPTLGYGFVFWFSLVFSVFSNVFLVL